MTTQTASHTAPAPRPGRPAPASRTKKGSAARAPGERSLAASPTTWVVWAGIAAFFVFLVGILVSVVTDSFGKPWFDSWLPENFTTSWYTGAWDRFGMAHIIGVTLAVAVILVWRSTMYKGSTGGKG